MSVIQRFKFAGRGLFIIIIIFFFLGGGGGPAKVNYITRRNREGIISHCFSINLLVVHYFMSFI